MLNFVWKVVLGAMMLFALGGCGGGSGACQLPTCPGTDPQPTNPDDYILSMRSVRLDGTSYDQINDALIFGEGVKVIITLKSKSGVVQPGIVVTAKVSDSALATLSTNGTVLTDTNGEGTLTITSASPSASGAVTLEAKATIKSGSASSDAVNELPFRINEKKITSEPGDPAYLKYISATPTRIFVSGGATGAANASEESVVSFKVLDITNAPVPGATVSFNVTKWNGGIRLKKDRFDVGITEADNKWLDVTANSDGVASVTIRSGSEPLSINVKAYATKKSGAFTDIQYSDDQIIISGKKPDQTKFFMLWDVGATCGKTGVDRVYPCKFNVYVGDEKGDPVADGTVVNLVSDTGIVVASKQAGQPSGACLTVNSQCSGEYTGKGFELVRAGRHHVIAYAVGNYVYSPAAATKGYTSKPVTYDGSWVDVGGFVASGGNVIVGAADADLYVRNCLKDVGLDADVAANTCVPVP